MKRIFSVIAAGALALLAFSCAKEEDKVVFDSSQTTAPVLLSATVADNVTVQFTPAVFNMNFNEKMATFHTLALVSVKGEPANVTLSTKVDGNTITLTGKNLTNALKARGCKPLDEVALEMVVRASIQDPARGITNGYVDSQEKYSFTWTMPEEAEQEGCPYEDFTEDSPWSLIGAMEAYGISWDGDLNMWTDGTTHVAAHVILKAGDEIKFRKDQAWTENMGGEFGGLDAEFDVAQDGDNIKVGADGVYDLYLDPDGGKAWVTAAYDPYPDYTEESTWSVIGALSLAGISWDGDIAMVSDGANHAAFAVALAADDEFKFRKDKDWAVNLGGEFGGVGSEFEVTQDGDNIKVGAAGVFDLFVNPDAGTALVAEASGLKISAKIGGEVPPEPVAITGWNIIGLNGDWDNDVLATQDGSKWTAFITAEGDTEFKWRKDGGWDENYGGVMVALGEPFEAVAGGDNIKVSAGFYKVVLDTEALTITVSNGEVWSLIGAFNEWAGDVDMVLTDGKWVSPATKLEGEFKIRHNHDWAESVGGTLVTLGEPFAAVSDNGPNISVEAGTYVVTYDPTAATITVDELGWGLVGTINSWGGTPDIILKEEGLFLVAKNVALTADDEIKLRYNQDWGENRGGKTVVGAPVKAVPGGDNIKPGVAGNYDVYYRPDSEVIIVNQAGAELSYWGVVGTINGWGAPDVIMYQNEDGLLESDELEITATDEIKIRKNEDWADNRGGTFVALDEPFAVENGGANIALGRDAKIQVVYDAAGETITIKGQFTGDAPAFPDNIYAIGGDTGWGSCYQLAGKNGQYKGFGYLSQEFKFKPNEDNWDGDWECTGEGQIGQGSDNCPAPATAGYYMIEVDLNEMTYKLTLITTIGIIGPAQAGGWDADTDMTYNAENGTWEVKGLALSAGDMKFRANDGWDINWGGSLDALTQGGDNIAVTAGTYDIVLYALCDGKAKATLTAAGGGSGATGITIDGDFSDWENINGVSNGSHGMFKASSDANNLYFYTYRTTEGRFSDLWGDGVGYIYFAFDLDGNPNNGESLNSNGPYDYIGFIYCFGGTAAAPEIKITAEGDCRPSTYTVNNIVCKGKVDDTGAYVEYSIPRADLPAIPNTEITITSWGNKDLSKVQLNCTL